ncbi:MAG: DNA glycosylase AlkZ-like family protein [Carbonactinosporaceae bacterium]
MLRTHVLRPTWHFVLPQDIRWMLELTAPRVHALNAYYYRKLELDDAVFAKCHALLVDTLRGGHQLTRRQIHSLLEGSGIMVNGLRPGTGPSGRRGQPRRVSGPACNRGENPDVNTGDGCSGHPQCQLSDLTPHVADVRPRTGRPSDPCPVRARLLAD